MTSLMITWTDIFEGIGEFSYLVFKGMRFLGHGPNVFISLFVVGLLVYWTVYLKKYKNQSKRTGIPD
ncbi:MAG: hypothetical protein Q8L81_17920 [Bacteroidota bacterium]|nr:hypothetical protein [Bacteroidota bacterium]